MRELLARSKTSINMNGIKKTGYYPLILDGEELPISVMLNERTQFSKLQVGKHVVTARQPKGITKVKLFPLSIALNGLAPLSKILADYEPPPKN